MTKSTVTKRIPLSLDELCNTVTELKSRYDNGLLTKGEFVLRMQYYLNVIRDAEMEKAIEIAWEYGYKVVPKEQEGD